MTTDRPSDNPDSADTTIGENATTAPTVGLRVGEAIGPYRLLEVLGEGGFGVVWLAEQREPIRRRVALKVIKPGMDTAAVLARFEAERNALAVMDHPHIARVLDGGATKQGLPYFVMEFVPGDAITNYCKKHDLDLHARLRLFAQVCQAVQHAHAKGVIHRDLKPGNILVREIDGEPAAKVIDFGVAKALDNRLSERTLFTTQGHIVGTPEYMAPEQAEGAGRDIDTRADVYSLGVVLYELLTGDRPFNLRSAAVHEIARIIQEVEPERPSTRVLTRLAPALKPTERNRTRTLARALRNDLDWVVMKCLEKDRQRRYQTAIALAEDLERFLRGDAVEAGPPSVAYRAGKFLKRHRVLVATAASVAVLTIAFIAVLSVALVRERAATERAERAAESERGMRTYLLEGIISAARPERLGKDVTVVDAVRASIDERDKYLGDNPLSAAVQSQLAIVLSRAGRDREALELARAADGLWRESGSWRSDPEGPPDGLFNKSVIAVSLARLGRPDEADPVYAELIPLAEAELGAEHPFTLGMSLSRAVALARMGNFREALAVYERVREVSSRVEGDRSKDVASASLSIVHAKAELNEHEPTTADAHRALVEEAREARTLAIASDERGPLALMGAGNLLQALANTLDPDLAREALTVAEDALAIANATVEPNASSVVAVRHHRARCRIIMGEIDAGLAELREAIALHRSRVGESVSADRAEIVMRCRLVQALREAGRDATTELAALRARSPLSVVREIDPARGWVASIVEE